MINVKMQPTEVQKLTPKITVIGVGGAGGNAVNNMISSGLEGCDFLVCNTDAQALSGSLSTGKMQLGTNVTGGLGAGSKPEVGKAAAEESLEEVMSHVEGSNMVFVTAGMGGGTGTGAAPVIAKACRERGILTVGVVTKPFHFEGSHRMTMAEEGLEEIKDYVDTLIVIPNQNLFRVANERTTFAEAFQMADSVLQAGVRGVTDLMVRPGLVNLDFADIRTAMLEMGKAMMGTGEAEGEKRATEAAEAAINNPLLDDVSMKGAHGVIINVTGGFDMTLFEADEACNKIREEVDPTANIIFGATFDESLEGKMRVSIVATGIEREAASGYSTQGGAVTLGGGNGGGQTVLERAQPQTDQEISAQVSEAVPMEAPAQQEVAEVSPAAALSGAQALKNITAPPVHEVPADMIQPENDVYEQAEFAISSSQGAPAIPSNTAMRGTRYKDSFIPPKPMDVSGGAAEGSEMHSSPLIDHAQNAQPSSSGLKLNPPKPTGVNTGGEVRESRSPSLFERITGTVQQGIEGVRQATGYDTAEGHQGQAMQSRRSAPSVSSSPAQGSLDITSPSKPAGSSENDLDIPAFLRRQAN